MDEQDVAVEVPLFISEAGEEKAQQDNSNEPPLGWRTLPLKDVLSNLLDHRGLTPKKLGGDFSSSGIPVISAMNVNGGRLVLSRNLRFISQELFERWMPEKLQLGDVLLTSEAPLGEVAQVPTKDDYCLGQRLFALRPNPEILDASFLYFVLRSDTIQRRLHSKASGTTAFGIRQADLVTIRLEIPPLSEQRAIARTLRALQEVIQTRQREADLERERKVALLQHLFTYGMQGSAGATKETPFGHIPASWHIMLLESCAFVQTGVTKGRDLDGHNTVTRPYLRVANVQDGYLDLSEMKEIELLASEVDRYLLQPGDVVMTEGGDFDKLGRGFIWQGQVSNCVHQNHIFAVRVNRDLLLPQFFAYLIQSSYGKAYFLSVAHRTTNLASINSTKLKALPTLLPSLSEQQGIVAVLDACDTKLSALEQETRLLEELFRVFLEELMTGRLSTVPLMAVEVAHE